MKLFVAVFALYVIVVSAENRVKRQVDYAFPGPRSNGERGGGSRRQAAGSDRDRSSPRRIPPGFPAEFQAFAPPKFNPFQPPKNGPQAIKDIPPPQLHRRRVPVQRFPQDSFSAAPRPRPAAPRPRPAARPVPVQIPVQRAPARRPAPQPYERRPARRPVSRRPVESYDNEEPIESEEPKIDPLTELLAQSTFVCGSKKDGYYADSSDSVNCQAFHYCLGGKKHSWMCQDGQTFHQVHLICVPGSGNGICKKSSDYEFVNDYLYKPIRQEKNITIYADRFYPDNYSLGDPIGVPAERSYTQEEDYAPEEEDPYKPRRPAAAPHRRRPQQYAPPPQRSTRGGRDQYEDESSYYENEQY